MSKSKTPDGRARGIAAYQRTLRPEQDAGPPAAKGAGLEHAPEEKRTAAEKRAAGTGRAPEKKRGPERKRAAEGGENGFIKTLKAPKSPAEQNESKYRRAAKFLILIGSAEAARILSELDKDQVEKISAEIASIRGITAGEADAALYEFKDLLASSSGYSGTVKGGPEAARRILYEAFGREKGEALLRKAAPESLEHPFSFLEEFSGEQIALLLRNEGSAAAALVLSRLSAKSSAAALSNISPDKKYDIVKRIARLGGTPPEVLEQVAGGLREKARALGGKTEAEVIDGPAALAAILKQGDLRFGERLLSELEEENPELGREMQERLNTIDDVVRAEDKPLQAKLRSMTDRDIAVLIKGKGEAFAQKIYANLSSSRGTQVREEGEILGAVPKRDVDDVTGEFLIWFRLNREEGNILLLDDNDIVV
ncbi:MAG: flagellar motor switch protein FliG [Spirochaetaceae bacterium]|jgi:flagellar motor switch protein FliG|nr:flagellar motor switch protein FliG [Spirochaetaceae bacterium]